MLQINTNIGYNSVGRIAEQIGLEAMKDGWRSVIAYGRDIDPDFKSQSETIKIGNKLDGVIHGLETRLFDRHGLGSTRATQKFIKEIDELSPDVIHLHNIHGYYLNYQILFEYLAQRGTPVVWTFHDMWPITGHCAFPDPAGCVKWQTQCHDCPLRKEYPASMFKDNSYANYLAKRKAFTSLKNLNIVTVSDYYKDIVNKSFLSSYSVTSIRNGVEILPIKKEKTAPYILGVASNWEPRKGLNQFIELRELLPKNIDIILIGLNDKQISMLPTGMTGIKRLSDKSELYQYYANAIAYVNLSMGETLSLTNLEAQACGIPTVTYASGGTIETVSAKTGIALPAGDILTLASYIKKIINRELLFTPDACRAFIANNFNAVNAYRPYIEMYDRL